MIVLLKQKLSLFAMNLNTAGDTLYSGIHRPITYLFMSGL